MILIVCKSDCYSDDQMLSSEKKLGTELTTVTDNICHV